MPLDSLEVAGLTDTTHPKPSIEQALRVLRVQGKFDGVYSPPEKSAEGDEMPSHAEATVMIWPTSDHDKDLYPSELYQIVYTILGQFRLKLTGLRIQLRQPVTTVEPVRDSYTPSFVQLEATVPSHHDLLKIGMFTELVQSNQQPGASIDLKMEQSGTPDSPRQLRLSIRTPRDPNDVRDEVRSLLVREKLIDPLHTFDPVIRPEGA